MSCTCALRRTLVLLVAMLVGPVLFAQGTASVIGQVQDQNGGALPGVSIVLQNLTQGGKMSTVTDSVGQYSFTGVAPGSYRLTAALGGFTTQEIEVTVTADKKEVHDFTLELASFFNNITVTAAKREQEILDVPASITAVTGISIERQGVTNLDEIQGSIPGLSIVDTGPGTQRTQIRGISSPQNLPTVGQYLDEMPITAEGAGSGLDVRLLDLERVEVLRGPQGTLYGEGSMGGTIKYVTRDPLLDALEVSAESAYGWVDGGTGTYRANAVVNIPVVEGKLGFRVLAGTEHYPGWIEYPNRGVTDGNEGDSSTFRIKGLWIINDRFVASLMFQAQDSDFKDQNYYDSDGTAPFYLPQPVTEKSNITNLVLTYDAGSFSILSSTGYLDRTNEGSYDFTALYVPLFPPGMIDTVALNAGADSDTLTEELRFFSNGNKRLDWTAGFYYRKFEGSGFNLTETTPNPFPFELFETNNTDKTQQTALFGQAEYAFSKKLSGTLGLRYFRDKRERMSSVGQFGPAEDNPDQSGTFTSTNPRLVLSYRPSDNSLIYGSAAKGFRSGGFNLVPPGCDISTTYEPETLWTYEVGTSTSLDSGRYVIQSAVYYNDWKDIQTLALCPGTYVALTDNVGKASGTGIDLQFTVTPTRGLVFSLTGGYNDSQYDDNSYAHSEGDNIDYASEYNFGLAADWNFQWGQKLPGLMHIDYQQIGPFDLNFRNYGLPPLSSDTVGFLNTRLTITLGTVQIWVYGQNLLNEDGAISPAIPFGGVPSAVRPRPRTLGLGLGWHL